MMYLKIYKFIKFYILIKKNTSKIKSKEYFVTINQIFNQFLNFITML